MIYINGLVIKSVESVLSLGVLAHTSTGSARSSSGDWVVRCIPAAHGFSRILYIHDSPFRRFYILQFLPHNAAMLARSWES